MAAICFDMYGTLCDTASVTRTLRRELDVADRLVDAVESTWRSRQLRYSYQLALMESYRPFWSVTRDALDFALDRYDLAPDGETRDRILRSYESLEPFPGATEVLESLSADGHAVAVLSNGNPEMLSTLAGNAGLDGALDALLSADAAGTFKPAPAVYEAAAADLDAAIGDCWLVSGNAWDVAGAGSAGMETVWVNRANDPFERIGADPIETVESLSAVPEAVSDGRPTYS
ncbi:haloacid dehalogenase type II [Halorubrum aethiopicum]|uniref:haloacid dehalogenase type II n=1 Tax=Halorubrum aethiopicum TaxID=1758255 RepID=UPI00082C2511|nr:haloacid dehalogenase type II [Halorubrum aethiopicum]